MNSKNEARVISQNEFEQKLMNLLLQGDHPVLAILRNQYETATVISREFSGVGFFANFEVTDTAPRVEPANFAAGYVQIELENVRYGAGCVLFVREGKIVCLEGYTYDDPWPEYLKIKSVSDVELAIPE